MNTDKWLRSSEQGAEWVVSNQAEDGAFPSETQVVESCYKGIWMLFTAGHQKRAYRLADLVASWVDGDGDIPGPREDEAFLTSHYLYAHGYLAIGAQCLGRFDLSQRLFTFIRSRQVSGCGGFLSQGPQYTSDPCLDTVSTSICGLAALYMGDTGVAEDAARFLKHVFHSQPDPHKTFYTTTTTDGTLVDRPPPDAAHRVIQIDDSDQDWYFLGLPTVFLPRLFEATGCRQYLDLAEQFLIYLDEVCCDGAFSDFSSGKSGVGAAHLYRITRKSRYRDIAVGVADFILGLQHASGCWLEAEREGNTSPSVLPWSEVDMTAEYSLWLRMIDCYLG